MSHHPHEAADPELAAMLPVITGTAGAEGGGAEGAATLASTRARQDWVEPDLAPFP
jgi:hypothetical protein